MSESAALRQRLADVRERIARAAGRAGRDPSSVRLVAVSKTVPPERIRVLADAGQRDFGENKVQEALDKMARTADLPLTWHLVGHLQSNKTRRAAARFDVVHSIDDADLLARLDGAASAVGRTLEALIQVTLAAEPTKHGVAPGGVGPIVSTAGACRAVRLTGLMLLPPAVNDPEEARPWFRALRTLRETLAREGGAAAALAELSMGMSHDFEVAVEEGATLVRVGSAIFGERAHV